MEEDTFYDKIWYWWHSNVVWKIPLWIRKPIKTYKDNKLINLFPPGTIVEDCRCMPVIIIKNVKGDLSCWDILERHNCSCSLFHCGIAKLKPEYINDTIKKWDAGEINKNNFIDYIDQHPDRYLFD